MTRLTIMKRLLISFGGTSLLLLLFFGISILFITKQSITSVTDSLSTQLADSRSSEITRWLEGLTNEVKSFADLNIIKKGNLNETALYLESRHDSLKPEFAMIFFALPDGSYKTSLGGGGSISERSYFKAIVENGETLVISNQ